MEILTLPDFRYLTIGKPFNVQPSVRLLDINNKPVKNKRVQYLYMPR
jgi:hypothetical protein